MDFLADESCDFNIVQALEAAGHSVRAVAHISRRAADDAVLLLSTTGNRILLTEDKDFGQWVFAHHQATAGVIFLRYPVSARTTMCRRVVQLVAREGERLFGCFVVVEPGRVRIRRPPQR